MKPGNIHFINKLQEQCFFFFPQIPLNSKTCLEKTVHLFIDQVMVVGENQKFASALIVPAFAYLRDYCKLKGIEYKSNEDIIKNETIRKRILQEVENLNKDLAQYEKIKAPELLSREWSIEKNELTPKLSLKRKVILAENKELIDKIYKEKSSN